MTSNSEKKLDQVVLGTSVEAGDLVIERIARGQHQYQCVFLQFIAQLAADREAIYPRHFDVEDDRRRTQAEHCDFLPVVPLTDTGW